MSAWAHDTTSVFECTPLWQIDKLTHEAQIFCPTKFCWLQEKKFQGEMAEGRFNRNQQWHIEGSHEPILPFSWAALTWTKHLIWAANFSTQWLTTGWKPFFPAVNCFHLPAVYLNVHTHIQPPACATELTECLVWRKQKYVSFLEKMLYFFHCIFQKIP